MTIQVAGAQLQRGLRVIDLDQHGWRAQKIQVLSGFRFPFDGGVQNHGIVVDARLLHHALDGAFGRLAGRCRVADRCCGPGQQAKEQQRRGYAGRDLRRRPGRHFRLTRQFPLSAERRRQKTT